MRQQQNPTRTDGPLILGADRSRQSSHALRARLRPAALSFSLFKLELQHQMARGEQQGFSEARPGSRHSLSPRSHSRASFVSSQSRRDQLSGCLTRLVSGMDRSLPSSCARTTASC